MEIERHGDDVIYSHRAMGAVGEVKFDNASGLAVGHKTGNVEGLANDDISW